MTGSLRSFLRDVEDRLSVRQQIGLAAAVLCIVMATALAVGAAVVAYQQSARLLRAEMASLAGSMAESLDYHMYAHYRDVRSLAGMSTLSEVWTADPNRIRAALERMQSGSPDFAWIGFAGADGQVRVGTHKVLEGSSVASSPWFMSGLHGPVVVDVHDLVLVNPLSNGTSENPRRFIDVAAPVRDSHGTTIGVLGAHIDWKWAQDLRGIFLGMRQARDTTLSIIASDGSVLLGNRLGEKLFSASQLHSIQFNRRGTLPVDGVTLAGYAVPDGHLDYPSLGWIVIAERPVAVALAAARETALVILGVGLLAAVFGLGGSFFVANRVAKPLQDLTAEAERIGRDPGALMLPHMRGSTEILHLTTALRSLLRRVGIAEAGKLEVEERATEEARKHIEDVHALRLLAETNSLQRSLESSCIHERERAYFRARSTLSALVCNPDRRH